MKTALLLLFVIVGAHVISGCCSQCVFWDAVEKGYYIEPEREEKLQAALDRTMPAEVKTLARVIVRRGNRERVFTMLAKADRTKRKLTVAGLADLGTVIFLATWVENEGTRIRSNRSGWDDSIIHKVIIRDCLAVFLPEINPMNIIEDQGDGTVTLRARNKDGSLDRFVFDQKGSRWKSFERRNFRFMGEQSYTYTLALGSWETIPGHMSAIPHLIEIKDEFYRYSATIEIQQVSPVN